MHRSQGLNVWGRKWVQVPILQGFVRSEAVLHSRPHFLLQPELRRPLECFLSGEVLHTPPSSSIFVNRSISSGVCVFFNCSMISPAITPW